MHHFKLMGMALLDWKLEIAKGAEKERVFDFFQRMNAIC